MVRLLNAEEGLLRGSSDIVFRSPTQILLWEEGARAGCLKVGKLCDKGLYPHGGRKGFEDAIEEAERGMAATKSVPEKKKLGSEQFQSNHKNEETSNNKRRRSKEENEHEGYSGSGERKKTKT